MSIDQTEGSIERREQLGSGGGAAVKLWTQAIDLASSEEKDWRKAAKATVDRYRMEEAMSSGTPEKTAPRFNILYSNVETTLPSIYNSTPTPDIRRRFGDADPDAKAVSQALERAISACFDLYDFDRSMKLAVKDMLLPGRGISRVRYRPELAPDGQAVAYQGVEVEHVQWTDFRRGPGKTWADVQWVAFRHHLTRDQLSELSPKVGPKVGLDVTLGGADDHAKMRGENTNDLFKRAEVWEIWDKEKAQVIFMAPGFKSAPVLVEADPLKLEGFFPIPRPLYAIETSDSLIPVEEYRTYADQANELEAVTRRIQALVKVLKWRGVYDAALATAFGKMAGLVDGELAATDAQMTVTQLAGALDKAIWMMPIEQAAAVLQQLYVQREQIKQTIYEITGISDILRGATNATETATAQQIKAQWGSMRVQDRQREVARYARDLVRMIAELVSTTFTVETLAAMTGIQLTPEQEQLMRSDFLRSHRVDIETDSTIRADLTRSQEQMSQFVTGLGAFITAVGPAVQAGVMPMDIVADLLGGFARQFKLGKQAEDALDRLSSMAQQQAQQPPAEQGPTPEQMAMQAEQEKAQADAQRADQAEAARQQESQAKLQLEGAKLQLDREKAQAQIELEKYKFDQQLAADAQRATMDRDAKGTIERERMQASAKPSTMVNLDAKGELQAFVQAMQEERAQDRQEMQQVIALLAQGVQAMAEAADRMGGPKRIIKDARGEVIGVAPVEPGRTVN